MFLVVTDSCPLLRCPLVPVSKPGLSLWVWGFPIQLWDDHERDNLCEGNSFVREMVSLYRNCLPGVCACVCVCICICAHTHTHIYQISFTADFIMVIEIFALGCGGQQNSGYVITGWAEDCCYDNYPVPPVKGVELSTGQTPCSSTVDTGTYRCARTDTQTQTRTQADTDTHKNTRTHMRTHTLTLTLTLLWFVIFVVILELRICCCIVISKSSQHTFTYKHISSNL